MARRRRTTHQRAARCLVMAQRRCHASSSSRSRSAPMPETGASGCASSQASVSRVVSVERPQGEPGGQRGAYVVRREPVVLGTRQPQRDRVRPHPRLDALLLQELLVHPAEVDLGGDAARALPEQVGHRERLADAVVGARGALLARGDDPRGEVAGVGHLHHVGGVAGGEHLAAGGEPARPVAEAAGRVLGADDQPGSQHHRRRGAVEDQPLAGDLHRAVGLGVHLQVDVLLDRLDQRQGRGGAARGRVVGVHVDGGDEHPVRRGVRRERGPHPGGVPRHVDDGVVLAEVGERAGPVDGHQPRAVRHRAGRAARRAGHVVAARHRLPGHRPREEDRPTQHQESHAPTSPGAGGRRNPSGRGSAQGRKSRFGTDPAAAVHPA